MKFSSSLLSLGAFIGLASAKLQIMVVYDISQGETQTAHMKQAFIEGLQTAVAGLTETDVEFALATSVDKPVPTHGVGTYGGYPDGRPEDYCYKREVEFTTNFSLISSGITSALDMSGLDDVHAQLEAALAAIFDSAVGWDASATTDRLIITVTDNFAHVEEDEQIDANIAAFNQPVRCTEGTTKGGFGAVEANSKGSSWFVAEGAPATLYSKYAALHKERACDGSLGAADQQEYDTVRAGYPVRQWPGSLPYDAELLKTDTDSHCRFHHYPTYKQVVNGFNEMNAKWIVFHGDSTGGMGGMWEFTVTDETWGFAGMPMALANVANKAAITASESAGLLTEAMAALGIN